MVRNVVESPGIHPLFPFSGSVRLKQNWFPFGCFSVPHSQWDEPGEKTTTSAQLPQDSTDLSAAGAKAVCASLEAELSSWSSQKQLQDMDVTLRLMGRAEEPAGGCASAMPVVETGSVGGRAAWISLLPSTQFERENNNGGNNICWKNMGFTGALSGLTVPSVSFCSGVAGCGRKGTGQICLIAYASAASVSTLWSLSALILVLQHPSILFPLKSSFFPRESCCLLAAAHGWVWWWTTLKTSVRQFKEVLTHFYNLETNCLKSSMQSTSKGPLGKRAGGRGQMNWCWGSIWPPGCTFEYAWFGLWWKNQHLNLTPFLLD